MERMTLILLSESSRLKLRKDISSSFALTGDMLLYHLPPSVVLGGESDLRRRIELPAVFHIEKETGANIYGSYRLLCENSFIYKMQEDLGLGKMETGLHISSNPDNRTLETSVTEFRAHALALAEWDGHTFRIIQQKRL